VELDFLKKESAGTIEDKRRWVDPCDPELIIQRQRQLLGLARSIYYYQPRPESEETLALLRRLDELYMKRLFFGSRRMAAMFGVNRKRIQRLMRNAGIEALQAKPRLSRPGRVTRSIPTCSAIWRSSGPTRSGRATSLMCRCAGAFSTWWR
jgi:putative transposase